MATPGSTIALDAKKTKKATIPLENRLYKQPEKIKLTHRSGS